MREFLLFIAEQALEGKGGELTEQNIGCHVFGRSPGYNQSEDNVVRVSARQLRSKLREYFESEGRNEDYTLEVPKGAYTPVFTPVERRSAVPAAAGRWPWVAGIATLVAIIAIGVSIWLWRVVTNLKAAEPIGGPTPVGELMLKSDQPVTVVMSDFGLLVMEDLSGRMPQLEDYANRQYFADPPDESPPGVIRAWRRMASRQITAVGDVSLVSGLLRAHPDHRNQVVVRHARSMNIHDFSTGQFIILGGFLSIPWVSLFEPQLNFRLEPPDLSAIHNARPQPGERPEYKQMTGSGGRVSYARIGLAHNLAGTGRVLLVTGLNSGDAEAAAAFVLSPDSVPLMKRTLGVSDLSKIGYFELLLETSIVDGAGHGARIVAFRR
jgi:hypothetical protein